MTRRTHPTTRCWERQDVWDYNYGHVLGLRCEKKRVFKGALR